MKNKTKIGKNSGNNYKVGKGKPPVEHQFKKGNPGGGRPKGTRDFKTIFEIAARQVAQKLNLGEEPDVVQTEIVKRGIREGLGGNFSFYKDLVDRLYGKVPDKIEADIIETKVDKKSDEYKKFLSWRKQQKK